MGILWDVFSISVLMIFLIIFTYMLGLIVVKVIYNPQLISSIKSDIFTDLWILLTVPVLYICILIGVIARLGIAKEKYQEFYKKMNWNKGAISVTFIITIVIGTFGEIYLPDNVSLIGPLIGGLIAGCIVGKNYINGFVQGGLPAGIAGFIGFSLFVLLFKIKIIDWSNILVVLIVYTIYIITFFMIFFIMGSIGGVIGAGVRKRVSSSKDAVKEVS